MVKSLRQCAVAACLVAICTGFAAPASAQSLTSLPTCKELTNYDALQLCKNENQRARWTVEALSAAIARENQKAHAAAEKEAAENSTLNNIIKSVKETVSGFF